MQIINKCYNTDNIFHSEESMNPRIFLGILSAVVGLLAVINPQSSIEAIVILIGIGAIVNGINSILKVKRFSFSPYFERTVIIKSVAGILVGILAVILPFAFFNMIQKIVRILLYIQACFCFCRQFRNSFWFLALKIPVHS